MTHLEPHTLPPLPLLLWQTPPGLELALAQEGVPYRVIRAGNPLALHAGRFVLYDGRRLAREQVRAMLAPGHAALDVDGLRRELGFDPFAALVDDRATRATWRVGALDLTERVARRRRGPIRRRVVERIRRAVTRAGGIWARLAPFPHPYRSAFNLRVDLDEAIPEDYARFARARRPLDDCSTHFVSTQAYGAQPEVLRDLLRVDTQSHGHYHVVYREAEANRRNLQRAHATLVDAGFDPSGFAAPHGRWNRGLDAAMEGLGYRYSSDFSLGYDDRPFFPWLGRRFSTVLQVPVHPICEGLFLDAGETDGRAVADHLVATVRARVEAGEPAFVYGHPERRLGRMPEVVAALADAVVGEPLVWRTTLTAFADWWHWRGERRLSVVGRGVGRYEVQLDDWDSRYPLALTVDRGRHTATVPIAGPRTVVALEELAYECRLDPPEVLPPPAFARRPRSWRARVREAIDWETVTPVDELPTGSIAALVKKELRRWRAAGKEQP